MSDKFVQVLTEMEQYAHIHSVPIINRESAQLLQQIAAKAKPRSVLEVGTAIGYSTLLLANAMAANGKIITVEQDEQRITVAKQFLAQAGVLDKIQIIDGNAGEILVELIGSYDLMFIDAAKGQYLDYLHKVIDKLSTGAVIIADNVLFRGWVRNNQAAPRRFRTIVKRLNAYLEFVSNDPRFETVIYEIGDGMAVSHYQGETKI